MDPRTMPMPTPKTTPPSTSPSPKRKNISNEEPRRRGEISETIYFVNSLNILI
jgi:hypothetical protein